MANEDDRTNNNLPQWFASLIESARRDWVPLGDAASFLQHGAARAVEVIYLAIGDVSPPDHPEAGSLFIVDESRLRDWRDDGHPWLRLPLSSSAGTAVVAAGRAVAGGTDSARVLSWSDAGRSTAPPPLLLSWARTATGIQRRALRLAVPGDPTLLSAPRDSIWLVQYLHDDAVPAYDSSGHAMRGSAAASAPGRAATLAPSTAAPVRAPAALPSAVRRYITGHAAPVAAKVASTTTDSAPGRSDDAASVPPATASAPVSSPTHLSRPWQQQLQQQRGIASRPATSGIAWPGRDGFSSATTDSLSPTSTSRHPSPQSQSQLSRDAVAAPAPLPRVAVAASAPLQLPQRLQRPPARDAAYDALIGAAPARTLTRVVDAPRLHGGALRHSIEGEAPAPPPKRPTTTQPAEAARLLSPQRRTPPPRPFVSPVAPPAATTSDAPKAAAAVHRSEDTVRALIEDALDEDDAVAAALRQLEADDAADEARNTALRRAEQQQQQRQQTDFEHSDEGDIAPYLQRGHPSAATPVVLHVSIRDLMSPPEAAPASQPVADVTIAGNSDVAASDAITAPVASTAIATTMAQGSKSIRVVVGGGSSSSSVTVPASVSSVAAAPEAPPDRRPTPRRPPPSAPVPVPATARPHSPDGGEQRLPAVPPAAVSAAPREREQQPPPAPPERERLNASLPQEREQAPGASPVPASAAPAVATSGISPPEVIPRWAVPAPAGITSADSEDRGNVDASEQMVRRNVDERPSDVTIASVRHSEDAAVVSASVTPDSPPALFQPRDGDAAAVAELSRQQQDNAAVDLARDDMETGVQRLDTYSSLTPHQLLPAVAHALPSDQLALELMQRARRRRHDSVSGVSVAPTVVSGALLKPDAPTASGHSQNLVGTAVATAAKGPPPEDEDAGSSYLHPHESSRQTITNSYAAQYRNERMQRPQEYHIDGESESSVAYTQSIDGIAHETNVVDTDSHTDWVAKRRHGDHHDRTRRHEHDDHRDARDERSRYDDRRNERFRDDDDVPPRRPRDEYRSLGRSPPQKQQQHRREERGRADWEAHPGQSASPRRHHRRERDTGHWSRSPESHSQHYGVDTRGARGASRRRRSHDDRDVQYEKRHSDVIYDAREHKRRHRQYEQTLRRDGYADALTPSPAVSASSRGSEADVGYTETHGLADGVASADRIHYPNDKHDTSSYSADDASLPTPHHRGREGHWKPGRSDVATSVTWEAHDYHHHGDRQRNQHDRRAHGKRSHSHSSPRDKSHAPEALRHNRIRHRSDPEGEGLPRPHGDHHHEHRRRHHHRVSQHNHVESVDRARDANIGVTEASWDNVLDDGDVRGLMPVDASGGVSSPSSDSPRPVPPRSPLVRVSAGFQQRRGGLGSVMLALSPLSAPTAVSDSDTADAFDMRDLRLRSSDAGRPPVDIAEMPVAAPATHQTAAAAPIRASPPSTQPHLPASMPSAAVQRQLPVAAVQPQQPSVAVQSQRGASGAATVANPPLALPVLAADTAHAGVAAEAASKATADRLAAEARALLDGVATRRREREAQRTWEQAAAAGREAERAAVAAAHANARRAPPAAASAALPVVGVTSALTNVPTVAVLHHAHGAQHVAPHVAVSTMPMDNRAAPAPRADLLMGPAAGVPAPPRPSTADVAALAVSREVMGDAEHYAALRSSAEFMQFDASLAWTAAVDTSVVSPPRANRRGNDMLSASQVHSQRNPYISSGDAWPQNTESPERVKESASSPFPHALESASSSPLLHATLANRHLGVVASSPPLPALANRRHDALPSPPLPALANRRLVVADADVAATSPEHGRAQIHYPNPSASREHYAHDARRTLPHPRAGVSLSATDPRYDGFRENSWYAARRLRAAVLGWRVRRLMASKRVASSRARIADARRLIAEEEASAASGSSAFVASLRTQLHADVDDVRRLFGVTDANTAGAIGRSMVPSASRFMADDGEHNDGAAESIVGASLRGSTWDADAISRELTLILAAAAASRRRQAETATSALAAGTPAASGGGEDAKAATRRKQREAAIAARRAVMDKYRGAVVPTHARNRTASQSSHPAAADGASDTAADASPSADDASAPALPVKPWARNTKNKVDLEPTPAATPVTGDAVVSPRSTLSATHSRAQTQADDDHHTSEEPAGTTDRLQPLVLPSSFHASASWTALVSVSSAADLAPTAVAVGAPPAAARVVIATVAIVTTRSAVYPPPPPYRVVGASHTSHGSNGGSATAPEWAASSADREASAWALPLPVALPAPQAELQSDADGARPPFPPRTWLRVELNDADRFALQSHLGVAYVALPPPNVDEVTTKPCDIVAPLLVSGSGDRTRGRVLLRLRLIPPDAQLLRERTDAAAAAAACAPQVQHGPTAYAVVEAAPSSTRRSSVASSSHAGATSPSAARVPTGDGTAAPPTTTAAALPFLRRKSASAATVRHKPLDWSHVTAKTVSRNSRGDSIGNEHVQRAAVANTRDSLPAARDQIQSRTRGGLSAGVAAATSALPSSRTRASSTLSDRGSIGRHDGSPPHTGRDARRPPPAPVAAAAATNRGGRRSTGAVPRTVTVTTKLTAAEAAALIAEAESGAEGSPAFGDAGATEDWRATTSAPRAAAVAPRRNTNSVASSTAASRGVDVESKRGPSRSSSGANAVVPNASRRSPSPSQSQRVPAPSGPVEFHTDMRAHGSGHWLGQEPTTSPTLQPSRRNGALDIASHSAGEGTVTAEFAYSSAPSASPPRLYTITVPAVAHRGLPEPRSDRVETSVGFRSRVSDERLEDVAAPPHELMSTIRNASTDAAAATDVAVAASAATAPGTRPNGRRIHRDSFVDATRPHAFRGAAIAGDAPPVDRGLAQAGGVSMRRPAIDVFAYGAGTGGGLLPPDSRESLGNAIDEYFAHGGRWTSPAPPRDAV